ncbi:hypothetical protein DL96DRAFT_1603900 [Flagelloscypha sp. PMI_526]|nr:hypothetical protein DL96DRAFT_1603900 [Flagelloscypha sp. PMI_526]
MSRFSELKPLLKLAADATEDDLPFLLTALITSASRDDQPNVSLQQIYHALCHTGYQTALEPLDTIPVLLSCSDPAARDLVSLIAQCASPRETILASNEFIERIATKIVSDEDENEANENARSPTLETIEIMDVLAQAIPRLALRKKTPVDTLRPLGTIQAIITALASQSRRDELLILLSTTTRLVQNSILWVQGIANIDAEQLMQCKDILRPLLHTAISETFSRIGSNKAARVFYEIFPRLRMPAGLPSGWEESEEAITQAITLLKIFDFSLEHIPSPPEPIHLINVIYTPGRLANLDPITTITTFQPLFLAGFQSNTHLDELLALLLTCLARVKNISSQPQLPDDIVATLSSFLPMISASHPDPTIRHITFRTFSLLISLTSPTLRLHVLKDLTSPETNNQFPQLQVASVGLVKEALIEAYDQPYSPIGKLFLSTNAFWQTFGPILFRPNPHDLFGGGGPELEEFLEEGNSECSRLVECLGLYFVLIVRDRENQYGMRSKDRIQSVESSLLTPLRKALKVWLAEAEGQAEESKNLLAMKLSGLLMGLERIDGELSNPWLGLLVL